VKFIDRFTLDDVSASVWWPATLVALVAFVLTFPFGNRAVDDARADAAARAAAVSRSQIQPLVNRSLQSDELGPELAAIVADDPTWSAVRVWGSTQFALLASSDGRDPVGSSEWINDGQLRTAFREGSSAIVTDSSPTNEPADVTFHAYTEIPSPTGTVATEFEARDSVLLADVHRDWLGYRIVGALATLLLLGFAVASMREPRARIGTNVPFYEASVPAGMAVVDVDRAVELDQADERIQDRISGLQERLDESERLRLKAEAQLQQALTALGSGARALTRPQVRPAEDAEPPTPTPRPAEQKKPAAAAPRQQPAARQQPAEPARQPAAPARRPAAPAQQPAARTPTSQPAPQRAPVQQPQPTPRRTKPTVPAKPAARATPPAEDPAAKHIAKTAAQKVPPPPVTAPQPAAKAPPPPPKRSAKRAPAEPVTVSNNDVSVTATPRRAGDRAEPEVVVLPEPEKPPAKQKVGANRGASSDADVLDVLNRLVPDNDDGPQTKEPPGDLRARLARTAALKKPGSRERQEQREAATNGPPQE
jgi:hypothetical protein